EVKSNPQQFLDEYVSEDFEKHPEIKIHLEFYKDEVILIRRFMNLIHRDKPDFAFAWNSNYDIKYIIGRMEKHGLDVNKEWCHPDIPDKYKQFRFIEDAQRLKKSNPNEKDKKKDFSRLWDKVLCPGYTVFLDQMSLYSNLRKRYIEHSYKLDYIAEKVVGANKVDLHEFGLNIRNAPFKDFKRFLKYSIRDTFLLWLIEVADDDLTDYNLLCENTDVWNGVNVSIKIKNVEYMMMVRDRNEVMGNTIDYGVNERIDGALVQEPSLVDAECVEVNGKKTKLYEAIADFDAESLYPSLMLQGKIGKENNRYRVTSIVDHDNNDKFLMSGQEFNQLLQTKSVSIIDICNTLYGLPKVEDVLTNIQQTLVDKGDKNNGVQTSWIWIRTSWIL
ncbi:MAG: hypothetical protein K2N99_03075, partial [Malacoplasma sp.]|nr:hypothetical protein [Malacoplasma sp.]